MYGALRRWRPHSLYNERRWQTLLPVGGDDKGSGDGKGDDPGDGQCGGQSDGDGEGNELGNGWGKVDSDRNNEAESDDQVMAEAISKGDS